MRVVRGDQLLAIERTSSTGEVLPRGNVSLT
ncbi:hypothetical protein VPHD273_0051 [Vibrio phage D273]